MNRKVGYVLFVLTGVCLLCGCKKEVTNKFAENIRSSYASSTNGISAGEIIGKIKAIDGSNITITLMEKEESTQDKKPQGMSGGAKDEMNQNSGSDKSGTGNTEETLSPEGDSQPEPEVTEDDAVVTQEPEASVSPSQETGKTPSNNKPVTLFFETDTTLDVTIDEETVIQKNEKDISIDDLKAGNIIYIDSDGERITSLRVSSSSNNIDDKAYAPQSSGDTSTSEP